MSSITAKEIAEKIKRPGEPLQAAVDRLRHYAREGLVEPEGEKHPGTGRKRLYPRSALLDCFIIEILTDAVGVPVVKAKAALEMVRNEIGSFERRPPPGRLIMFGKSVGGEYWSITRTRVEHLSGVLKDDKHDVQTFLRLDLLFDRLKGTE